MSSVRFDSPSIPKTGTLSHTWTHDPVVTTRIIKMQVARLLTISLVLMYVLLLLWILKEIIAPQFGYMGYQYQPPDSPAFGALSIFLAVLPAFALPISADKPGNVMLWIIFVLAYIPGLIVPVFASGKSVDEVFELQASMVIGMTILMAVSSFRPVRLPWLTIPLELFWLGVWAFTGFVFAVAIYSYGIPTSLPNLTDVYDVRNDFKDQREGIAAYVLLLMNWQQKVINPFLIAYGLVRKKPTALTAGIVGQLCLFGINGQKSVFFSGLMVLAVLIAIRNRGKVFAPMVALGSAALVAISGGIALVLGTPFVASLFVRRLILTPGLLTGYYYEFFGQHQKALFSTSVFFFFEYPHSLSLPQLIGAHYFGRPEMNANANFWADGFANMGILGLFGVSLLLGVVIWVYNSLALGRNLLMTSVIAGMCAWTLTDTAFFTSLNTHGILFSLLLLWLMPPEIVGDLENSNPMPLEDKWSSVRRPRHPIASPKDA